MPSWPCCGLRMWQRPRGQPLVRVVRAAEGLGSAPFKARVQSGAVAVARALVGPAVDLVVLKITGEFGGVLLLEQPLKTAPRRVTGLLAAALGQIKILVDLIEIDVPVPNDGFVSLFVLKFVCFRLLAHAGPGPADSSTARS